MHLFGALSASGHNRTHLLLQLLKQVLSVAREAALPERHVLLLHHPQLALDGLDQSSVVGDQDHATIVHLERVTERIDGFNIYKSHTNHINMRSEQ